jgi:hypothetical protein
VKQKFKILVCLNKNKNIIDSRRESKNLKTSGAHLFEEMIESPELFPRKLGPILKQKGVGGPWHDDLLGEFVFKRLSD